MKRKTNKLASCFKKMLDILQVSSYNDDMLGLNLNISPKEFRRIKDQYDAAIRARQEDIIYLYHTLGWKQQRIADHYKIDITAVNRILKNAEKREEEE